MPSFLSDTCQYYFTVRQLLSCSLWEKKLNFVMPIFWVGLPFLKKSWKSNYSQRENHQWLVDSCLCIYLLLDTSSLHPKLILHRLEMNVLRKTPTKRQQKPPGWTPRPQQWLENDFATWNPGCRKNVESNGLLSLPTRNLAPPRRAGKMICFFLLDFGDFGARLVLRRVFVCFFGGTAQMYREYISSRVDMIYQPQKNTYKPWSKGAFHHLSHHSTLIK